MGGFKFLVIARSAHGAILERYWLRRRETMFHVRAVLMRDYSVAHIQVEELGEQEAKAS